MNKKFVKIIVILGAIVMFVAVVGEFSLRIFPELRPSASQKRIESAYKIDVNEAPWWVHDDELGFLEKPHRNIHIETIDFEYKRTTDGAGFANYEPWPEQADIIFLGDSLLSGVGVGIDGQFTTLVSDKLSDRTVINLGLPGSSPEHLYKIFMRFGADLEPGIVFACLYVASDIDNAKRFHAWQRFGRQWPYEEFRAKHYIDVVSRLRPASNSSQEGNEDVVDGRVATEGFAWLRSAVKASVLGRELLYIAEPYRKGRIHGVQWEDGSEVLLYRRFQDRLEKGIGSDYPSIREIFFQPLDRLRQVVEANGSVFVIALIPSKEEVFAHPDEKNNLKLVIEVRDELKNLDMQILDLYPAIREVAVRTAPYYAHDIHLNEVGNDAVATAIVKWIRKLEEGQAADSDVRSKAD